METNKDLALRLFEGIRADFPHLKMELDPGHANVEVNMDIPEQPGLLFKVNVNLQADELHLCAGRSFWVEWFPCTDPAKVDDYLDAVRGILSGKHRIVESYVFDMPATASLERLENGKWVSFANWGNFWGMIIPWKRTTQVIQNVSTSRSV